MDMNRKNFLQRYGVINVPMANDILSLFLRIRLIQEITLEFQPKWR